MTDSSPAEPSLKQKMLSGSIWVLFGKSTTVVCTLLSDMLLARILDTDSFGLYTLAFSFVSVTSIVAQLGLHQAVVRFVAESIGLGQGWRARAAIGVVYRWAPVGGLTLIVLLQLGAFNWLLRLWDAPQLGLSIGTLSLWAVLISFQVITSETFRGFKDLRFAALFGGALTGILNVSMLALIFFGWGTTTLATIFHVVVIAASCSTLVR